MPVKNKPAATPTKAKQRPIVFPEVTLNGKTIIPREKLKVTAALMKGLMGHETESEYKQRTGSKDGYGSGKNPGYVNKATGEFIPVLYTDAAGERCTCAHNAKNRFFKEGGMLRYRQEILKQRWKLNLETIIFSNRGVCLSGQKRGAALIDAATEWRLHPDKYPQWQEEPWIEALIAAGCEDDDETIQTLDNVDPRTLADAFYTSGLFTADTPPRDKDELSRMLDAAVDLLWVRTGVDAVPAEERTYQTIAEGTDFLRRHDRLRQCVKHVFEENKDRGISTLKISAGAVAACMYLMGCGASDPAGHAQTRDESKLDWSQWDKAEEFITLLAQSSPEEADLHPVRRVIGELVSVGPGTGRAIEKMVVLAKAWPIFLAGESIEDEAIRPAYLPADDRGRINLAEFPGFGGIDLGPRPEVDEERDEEVQPEEVRERIAKEQAERVAAARAASKQPLPKVIKAGAGKVDVASSKPDAEIAVDILAVFERTDDVHEGAFQEEVSDATPAAIKRVLLSLAAQHKVKRLPGDRWGKVEANGTTTKKSTKAKK